MCTKFRPGFIEKMSDDVWISGGGNLQVKSAGKICRLNVLMNFQSQPKIRYGLDRKPFWTPTALEWLLWPKKQQIRTTLDFDIREIERLSKFKLGIHTFFNEKDSRSANL